VRCAVSSLVSQSCDFLFITMRSTTPLDIRHVTGLGATTIFSSLGGDLGVRLRRTPRVRLRRTPRVRLRRTPRVRFRRTLKVWDGQLVASDSFSARTMTSAASSDSR
jgi:hypothetical protein